MMAVPDLLRLRMIDEPQTNPKNIYNGMWFASFHLYRISSLQCHHSKFDAISRNGEFEKRDYERFFFFFLLPRRGIVTKKVTLVLGTLHQSSVTYSPLTSQLYTVDYLHETCICQYQR